MKFTVQLSDFREALHKVMPAVPPKSTIPVLEHIKLELKGSSLSIVGTDQDISVMATLEVSSEREGSVLAPARKLFEIIKALSGASSLSMSVDDVSYDILLKANNGKYTMKGLDSEEYIYLPELENSTKPNVDIATNAVSFSEGELSRLASRTAFAISKDEYRPSMTGAFFQIRQEGINVASTDSFRLVRAKHIADYPNIEDMDILIPSRMVEYMKRIDDCTILSTISQENKITHVRLDYGDNVVISRVIDEKFPPYESVIPTEMNSEAKVEVKALLSAIKRVSLFANSTSKRVSLAFANNQIIVRSKEGGGNSADEVVECDYTDESVEIDFNYINLEEILQNVNEEIKNIGIVSMRFFETGKPILIMPTEENEKLLSLLMPVRA